MQEIDDSDLEQFLPQKWWGPSVVTAGQIKLIDFGILPLIFNKTKFPLPENSSHFLLLKRRKGFHAAIIFSPFFSKTLGSCNVY